MKNMNEVFACFKDFNRAIQTRYGAIVKVLRSDNGSNYTKITFTEYLSDQGIHQTTCPYTPAQNGVARRKNNQRVNYIPFIIRHHISEMHIYAHK